jgi:hypothetical protein
MSINTRWLPAEKSIDTVDDRRHIRGGYESPNRPAQISLQSISFEFPLHFLRIKPSSFNPCAMYKLSAALFASTLLAQVYGQPTIRNTAKAYDLQEDKSGVTVRLSAVTTSIFGQDAEKFDYYLASPDDRAAGAMTTFQDAINIGDETSIAVAFLNVTVAGTMPTEHASDLDWICQTLGREAASQANVCRNTAPSAVQTKEGPKKRSTWNWVQSTNHVSSADAVTALYTILGTDSQQIFPDSPRSFCNTREGKTACISWSSPQYFAHEDGQTFIADAQSVVDFNRFSAQANGVLGQQPPLADICISDRPNGCT